MNKRLHINVETTSGTRKVAYWYREGWDGIPDELDHEHISKLIEEGYVEGELCTTDPEYENTTRYGWWKLA